MNHVQVNKLGVRLYIHLIFKTFVEPSCECGVNGNHRIINGDDADPGEFPWQVALIT